MTYDTVQNLEVYMDVLGTNELGDFLEKQVKQYRMNLYL